MNFHIVSNKRIATLRETHKLYPANGSLLGKRFVLFLLCVVRRQRLKLTVQRHPIGRSRKVNQFDSISPVPFGATVRDTKAEIGRLPVE